MADTNLKKFLDQSGVGTLWGKITAQLNAKIAEEVDARDKAIATAVKAETDRATLAEADLLADIEALEKYVGTLPEGTTAADIVAYIQEKTAGIATDAALEELQGAVNSIVADYLKAADKTELAGLITAEKTRAEGVEGGLDTRLGAVEADYLKTADKTELQGNIDGVSGKVTTLIGDDANKSVRTIANEELAAQLIGADAKESLDTLAEIAAWIQSHPEDASAMNQAIVAVQKQLQGFDAGEGTVKAYVDGAIAALNIGDYATAANLLAATNRIAAIEADYLKAADKTALQGAIDAVSAVANAAAVKSEVEAALALKAAKADLEGEVTRAKAAEKANADAISAEESRAKLAEKANADAITAIKDDALIDSFADVVTELAKKQNTIAANTYDTYGAAASALEDANDYTDTEFGRIKALSTSDIETAIAEATGSTT